MGKEFVTRDSQTFFELLRRYDNYINDKNPCDQCRRPWNDGICECSNSDLRMVKHYAQMGKGLIKSGMNLDKFSADIDFSQL